MENIKSQNRRDFLKSSALVGGGLMLNFSWFSKATAAEKLSNLPETWSELAGYIKITPDNVIKILCPNPEFGQNVMTSLPMMVAEELDCDWKNVVVEMGTHDNVKYGPQFVGGSNSMRMYWKPLRNAGATARQMLIEAAAQTWGVSASEITTKAGVLSHSSGKSATYGEMAAKAVTITVPKEVKLKAVKDFTIISHSKKNAEGLKIVTGKPLFGIDYKVDGMLIAMIQHPPAFGMKLKSFDATAAKKMPGIKDIFSIKLYDEGYEQATFDTRTFNEMIAIVGASTWQVMNARKKINAQWVAAGDLKETKMFWGGEKREITLPARLETTANQLEMMAEFAKKPAKQLRKDGDPEAAFKNAATIIERTYNAPFLAHNCMEPMNFFAHVQADKALIAGPTQGAGAIEATLVKLLNLPADKIEMQMTRMGGGFGRRSYNSFAYEAARISQKLKAPIHLTNHNQ